MKKYSLWLENINEKPSIPLNEDLDVDVLIIGGGMTGVMTAYHLRNENLKICLVEKNLIGHGITSRTTGKITYLQDDIYSYLSSNYSFDIAKKYFDSQKESINIIKNIIYENKIDCDFEKVDSYIFANNKKKIKKEKKVLMKLNVPFEEVKLYDKYAIKVLDTYVFHPLKYLYSIKKIIEKDILIYENSCVTEIKKNNGIYMCSVNKKIVRAKKVVIACHYPFFLIPFFFPIKTYLEKSYISTVKTKENKKISAISIQKPIVSIRYYNNNLFYLTNPHNICFKNNEQENFKKLKNNADYIWSNHDIITFDRLPFIGRIKSNLFISTGYNTWGMTNSNLGAKIISDNIMERKNKYNDLFDPNRKSFFLKFIKYPLNAFYSGKSLIQNKLKKDKSWYSNIKFDTKNGKKVAIYTDENKQEHTIYTTCPHLGCTLLFNEIEKTWDCPCHGSRFDIDGHSICGPSKKDIDICFKK